MKLTMRYTREDKTCGKHYLPEQGDAIDMFAPGGTTTCLSCTCCTCAAAGVTPFSAPRNASTQQGGIA